MTKGEIILTILERGAEVTSDLFYLYGTISYREAARRLGRLMDGYHHKRSNWTESYQETQKFYSALSHLRAQGFISKHKRKDSTSWKITGHGLRKIRKVRENVSFSKKLSQFANIPDKTSKIVIFDVPERDRKKRAWLRSALSSMGFSLLQKSVWIGRKKMPQEFFFELHRRKMSRYVHVFAITQSGTLINVDSKN